MQIEELGTLESPIALTNTLNVGLVQEGLVDYMVHRCERENMPLKSYNPVVCECNDSYLNDICHRVVAPHHVKEAIEKAQADFQEGDVGAGKGMSCHQLKGGIGSSSRVVVLDNKAYTVGFLVQSNHGQLKDLTIDGRRVGKEIIEKRQANDTMDFDNDESMDKGSIIIVIATDLPVSDRQLKRMCKRGSVGLARLGSYIGHGSGEVVIGFSTAQSINEEDPAVHTMYCIKESLLETVFEAVADGVREAILNSMLAAETVVGYKENKREHLGKYYQGGSGNQRLEVANKGELW